MFAATALALAASLPLGVWPSEIGPAATTVQEVEFYLADPEDDYTIIAVQALAVPLTKAEPAELRRLATLAEKLGADGVLLLGEMREGSVPDDYEAPLPTSGRYAVAVFLSFERGDGWEGSPVMPGARFKCAPHTRAVPLAPRARAVARLARLPKGGKT
jgi:hypothetical protein